MEKWGTAYFFDALVALYAQDPSASLECSEKGRAQTLLDQISMTSYSV